MSHAVIKAGGKQFLVEEGQTIRVPSLTADAGSAIELEGLLSSGVGERFRRRLLITGATRRSLFSRRSAANSTSEHAVTVRAIPPSR